MKIWRTREKSIQSARRTYHPDGEGGGKTLLRAATMAGGKACDSCPAGFQAQILIGPSSGLQAVGLLAQALRRSR